MPCNATIVGPDSTVTVPRMVDPVHSVTTIIGMALYPKNGVGYFCFLPALLAKAPEISRHYAKEYTQLEIIVHRVDRLSASIGHFLAFTSQPTNQRPEYISNVRHYMRKLYKIQFAVSPNPDVSFGLDLAGLHRILAGRPLTNGNGLPSGGSNKQIRRPRFTFVLDLDSDWTDSTRCFCRGSHSAHYLLNSPAIICGNCKRRYHTACVFYPPSSSPHHICVPSAVYARIEAMHSQMFESG